MCANMGFIEQAIIEDQADALGDDIIKQYAKYNVNINITQSWAVKGRFVFRVKIKGNSREAHIRAHASDVQLKLKLPLFNVEKYNFTLYIITSKVKIEPPHLLAILCDSACRKVRMQLPYVVGHNSLGDLRVLDLAKQTHMLLGGSTNSGKSVGLQALISSIAFRRSPSMVNLILIDVGANDLMAFAGLPHLSCPIVRDRNTAYLTLAALEGEMERRRELEVTNKDEFEALPQLVLVIDEFPALFAGGVDKRIAKRLSDIISSLLQKGRHAKIHVVLAAQNPTFQNMKVDLGNITARIAFTCAKKNFSETILGEAGAEKLSGSGDMLLKIPKHDLQRIQGIYITEEELALLVKKIILKYSHVKTNEFMLTISNDNLTAPADVFGEYLSCSVTRRWPTEADSLLASVIVWALERNSISINMLMNDYQLGWNKASKLVNRLEELGIVDRPEGKLPRKVIPSFPEELPQDLIEFLKKSGYSENLIINACYSRDCD